MKTIRQIADEIGVSKQPVIIIGMMSIGIAGYVCSAIIRFAGTRMTPWLRTF